MYILISPAKTQDFNTHVSVVPSSKPRFTSEADRIVARLKKMHPKDLSKLMHISDDLARQNYERYQQWKHLDDQHLKEAIFAFKGDVYQGLDAVSLTEDELHYAQNHLRILSGMYGILRPLDKIAPHRLEMGTLLSIGKASNLYAYWKSKIHMQIKEDLNALDTKLLVNLASNEYFKSVTPEKLNIELVTPIFKDFKNGEYKVISFFAKKARGMMTRHLLQQKASHKDAIISFNEDGYHFAEALSTSENPVFTRG
ncbi:MAG: peroxide stress protein YaaA [Bacteroidales bacterium]|nr:peroxide stress protein YaaA [Bacteroidales bacterium]HOI32755.1 peroxide stress protein YaaA [Bacteroidales bacterium]